MNSRDHAELERAYRGAEYRVILPSGQVRFRIGHHDPAAEARLREVVVFSSWTIVTPFNPHSVALCEQENLTRLEDFLRQLTAEAHHWLSAVNHDPAQRWPDEPGALVFDLAVERARLLGRAWQQNAVVRAEAGFAPQLLWVDER